jgi:hypothetical protein
MHWQSSDLWSYRSVSYALLTAGLVILFAIHFHLTAERPATAMCLTIDSGDYGKLDELSFNSNDHSFASPCTRNENIDLSYWFSLRTDRLIRASLFDELLIDVLTQKLAWFIRPAYHSTLASLWHPSILIAQGKLTI